MSSDNIISRLCRLRQRAETFLFKKTSIKIILYITFFIFGLALSKTEVFSKLTPFGISFLSAAPGGYFIPSFFGVFFGSLLADGASIPARYIASAIIAASLRWTLINYKKISESELFAPLLAFVSCFSSGLTMAFVSRSIRGGTAVYFAEALLCGGCAYFFSAALRVFKKGGSLSLSSLGKAETAGLGMLLCAAAAALEPVSLLKINLSYLFLSLLILAAARLLGTEGGAVFGIGVCLLQFLSGAGLWEISGVFAAGGLFAGIFCPVSKILGAASYLLSCAVFSLRPGGESEFISLLISAATAGIIFCFLPIEPKPLERAQESGRNLFSERLYKAGDAVSGVAQTLSSISEKLSEKISSDINSVFSGAVYSLCEDCPMRLYCFGEEYDKNSAEFSKISEILKQNGKISAEEFSSEFISKCQKRELMADLLTEHFGAFCASSEARLSALSLREIIEDELSAVSEILKGFSNDFEDDFKEDTVSSLRLSKALSKCGYDVKEAVIINNQSGRIKADIKFNSPSALSDKSLEGVVALELLKLCRRRFLIKKSGDMSISAMDIPRMHISCSFICKPAKEGALCGDSFTYFEDCDGVFHALLSDGMGTGGRAAIDGAMTVGIMEKLLSNGVGFRGALCLTNYALLSKSADESLSTLDSLSIDPQSGEAVFRKAGAAASIILKNGKTLIIKESSLPLGIMRTDPPSAVKETLSPGDTVIMLTDGVLSKDPDRLSGFIDSASKKDSESLSKAILSYAASLGGASKPDDMTVAVIKIESFRDKTKGQ